MDAFQSAAVAAVALVLGLVLVRHSKVLKKFCIPAAVIGGLIFALAALVFHWLDFAEFYFDDTLKTISMNIFFASVGFMASFKMLRAGGKIVAILIALVGILILIQNAIGIAAANVFGLDPLMGLSMGSIGLLGGHGTAAAYGEILVKDYGLVGADTVCIAMATFGLAIASFVGGPLGSHIVRKKDLHPSEEDMNMVVKEEEHPINKFRFLHGMIVLIICIGLGTLFQDFMTDLGITIPSYFGGMLLAFIVRNVMEKRGMDIPIHEVEVMGWICLALFLAMAISGLQLWTISGLALPMIVTVLIQLVVLILFVYFIVFRATGRNYESAALVSGVTGFGMGATPNAMANMEALTNEYGPAPLAYFIIPIIGGVFLDILNVTVLTILLNTL